MWTANEESDFAAYVVYRSTLPDTGFVPIAEDVSVSSFTDTTVVDGTTYYYFVTAVDLAGNESAGDPKSAG